MMIKSLAFATLAVLCSASYAEATPITITPPPKSTCVQPEDLGISPSDRQIKAYNKKFTEYQSCMQAYIAERSAAAKTIEAAHKLEIDAGNEAIKEFNAWVQKTKERNDDK